MIYIDTRCDIRYASFYIQGLYEIFGKSQVRFSNKYTSHISFNQYRDIVDRILLIVKTDEKGNILKKIAIDARDPINFLDEAYEWCDVYAKVNYRAKDDEQTGKRHKLVLIPPSFGFKLWSTPTTLFYAIYNLILSYLTKNWGTFHILKHQCIAYIWMILYRLPLSKYLEENNNDSQYVYLVSSLWNYKECIEHTNQLRRTFMECCIKNENIEFEGGFVIHRLSAEIPESWKHLSIHKRVNIKQYIKNTRRSCVVFNTPAVRQCHGWKLGEYLAMGKVIISTPLVNELTTPLEHGKNIFFVNSEKETMDAVDFFASSKTRRNEIAQEARKYFNTYAQPSVVISKIVD